MGALSVKTALKNMPKKLVKPDGCPEDLFGVSIMLMNFDAQSPEEKRRVIETAILSLQYFSDSFRQLSDKISNVASEILRLA